MATSHKVEVNSDFHSKKSVLYREDCMNQKYTSPQLYEKLRKMFSQKIYLQGEPLNFVIVT